jgi:hypothetical protein
MRFEVPLQNILNKIIYNLHYLLLFTVLQFYFLQPTIHKLFLLFSNAIHFLYIVSCYDLHYF